VLPGTVVGDAVPAPFFASYVNHYSLGSMSIPKSRLGGVGSALLSVAVAGVLACSSVGERVTRVSGNIEVTDAEVSFKLGGVVERRPVSEGELVRAGAMVAALESSDLREEVALRHAEVRAARATLDELLAGSRPEEIAEAEASLDLARAQADRDRREYARRDSLYEKQVASEQSFDVARAAHRVSRARVRAAIERLTLLRKGPRREDIDEARAQLDRAEHALALTETRLGYATLLAPMSGVVLSENLEVGEYAAPGTPVVTIGDLENVWLRAYVNETDLGRVKVGHQVCVTTDTYSDKVYEGRLSFIASEAEFTPKSVQTTEERVKLVYRVKIEIPNPALELKPGMPADADILLGGSDQRCTPSEPKR